MRRRPGPPEQCLKLSGFLPRPALNHDFRFGVELHGVAALTVQNSEEAVFPSAEWEIRHGRGHADIDADISRRSFVAEFSRRRTAGGEERSLVTVRAAVHKIHRFID